jgi:hypothetical protein
MTSTENTGRQPAKLPTRASERSQSDPDEPLTPPPPTAEELSSMPAGAGGLEDLPDELLPESEQVKEEINHAGLDVDLPGQEQARGKSAVEHTDVPPR